MGLFDFLQGADPTRHWVLDPALSLVFRFDDFTLNGIGLDDRVDELSGLGPAEDRHAARKGLLRYYSLGLEIATREELVDGFVLWWSWPNERECPFDSFAGQCLYNGREWPLHRETNFLDVSSRLGQPHRRENEDVGYCFVYDFPSVRMEVEFDQLDLLATIAVFPQG